VCRSQDEGRTWERVAGIAYPTAMAAGIDDQRMMMYFGTRGGMVTPVTTTQRIVSARYSALAEETNAQGAGVFRMTTLRPKQVFLPLVLRGF
jgi:hypothetical protein